MAVSKRGRAAGSAGSAPDAEYEIARLPRDMVAAVTWYMREHGITKNELARRLGVTPGRVSQILSGDENLTLRTLATVFAALGAHLDLELVPNDRPHHQASTATPDAPRVPAAR